MWHEINLNDLVKVRLTSVGELVVNAYYHSDKLPNWLQPDKDGYTTMQLWQVMRILGSKIEMHYDASEQPIGTTILVETSS